MALSIYQKETVACIENNSHLELCISVFARNVLIILLKKQLGDFPFVILIDIFYVLSSQMVPCWQFSGQNVDQYAILICPQSFSNQ